MHTVGTECLNNEMRLIAASDPENRRTSTEFTNSAKSVESNVTGRSAFCKGGKKDSTRGEDSWDKNLTASNRFETNPLGEEQGASVETRPRPPSTEISYPTLFPGQTDVWQGQEACRVDHPELGLAWFW
jgi:hypothetical protein